MDRRERGTLRGYIEILAHDLETDGGVINRQTMARYLRNALTRQDADGGHGGIQPADGGHVFRVGEMVTCKRCGARLRL